MSLPLADAINALLAPPSAEQAARVVYPSLKAILGPQLAAAGTPMPDTFEENSPETQALFVEFVRPILASALKGAAR